MSLLKSRTFTNALWLRRSLSLIKYCVGPETMHEVAFYHAFGRDLQIASEWLYKYNTTPNAPATYLNQASEEWIRCVQNVSPHAFLHV